MQHYIRIYVFWNISLGLSICFPRACLMGMRNAAREPLLRKKVLLGVVCRDNQPLLCFKSRQSEHKRHLEVALAGIGTLNVLRFPLVDAICRDSAQTPTPRLPPNSSAMLTSGSQYPRCAIPEAVLGKGVFRVNLASRTSAVADIGVFSA